MLDARRTLLIHLSILLIIPAVFCGCGKRLPVDRAEATISTGEVLLPISESGILSVVYWPDQRVYLVGDFNEGKTLVFDDSGEPVGESMDRLLAGSSKGTKVLALFADRPYLNMVERDGGGLSLEPTPWKAKLSFSQLPSGHLVSFEVDLANQLREIERKVDVLLEAMKEDIDLDETLVAELVRADGVEEGRIQSENSQWMSLIEIVQKHYGKAIGVGQLGPALQRECLNLVKIIDADGDVVTEFLNPPSFDEIGTAPIRVSGCVFENKIYAVNTIEPTLYIFAVDQGGENGIHVSPPVSQTFMDAIEAIPDTVFEYRSPSEESQRRYPEVAIPFTPTWAVFSLTDGTIVVQVGDAVNKNSALALFWDDGFHGIAVTDWLPMSSNGNILVMMERDPSGSKTVIRTIRDREELYTFIDSTGGSVELPDPS